ncbi:MAG: InlB B-repeat-containing protein [Clostridia bacterium]|nr:InlB B-repeat-containing protein [Clostridia bacterium]
MCFAQGLTMVGCDVIDDDSTFTVTFSAGVDDAVLISGDIVQTVNSANEIVEPVFIREGYRFVGWTSSIHNISTSRTVKAIWEKYSFMVVFDGGDGATEDGQHVVEKLVPGSSVIIPPVFIRKGYTLSWDTDLTEVNSACTVNAVWTANEYTLKFFDTDGSDVGLAERTITYDTTITDLPTLPDKDIDGLLHKFVRWEDSLGMPVNNGIIWNTDANVSVYAKWAQDEFIISYDLAGGNPTQNPGSYSSSDGSVFINNPTRSGYDFAGWTGTGISQAVSNFVIEQGTKGDISLVATWTPKTYTFSLDAGAGKIVGSSSKNITFASPVGELVEPTRDGYAFAGWVYSDTGRVITADTVWNIEPTELVLRAQYNRLYTVSFSLTSIVRKLDVLCALKSLGSINLNGKDFEEFTIVVEEGKTFADYGIKALPTVDPIEPAGMDEYSFGGYWKYYIGDNKLHKIYPDTIFSDESLPGAKESGVVKLIPHCRAHWTPAY